MINLYPHNQQTYNKILEGWGKSNKVAIVQATGTGKGFIILKCIEDRQETNKILLCPSQYIINHLEKQMGGFLPNTTPLTYSKLSLMSNMEIGNLNPEMIFLDEFHRCGAEVWGEGVQRLLSHFPDAKILGTSATPIRYLDNMRDMSDELFDGNVVNTLSLVEAISMGILPLPQYISAIYTYDEEIEKLKSILARKKSNADAELFLKKINDLKHQLENSKGMSKIFKKHLKENNNKFIVFCRNEEHLYSMKPVVEEWIRDAEVFNKISSYEIFANHTENESSLSEFYKENSEKEIKLLFSIDMLNEGVHIHDVSGVILLRPTISPIIYYQQIGRALEVSKANHPIIFDLVNNFNSITSFKSDIAEAYNQCINGGIGTNNSVDFYVVDETLAVKELFLELENRISDNWDYFFELFKQFKNEKKATSSYKPLSRWISKQRLLKKKGELEENKIRLLEEVGYIWDIEWEHNFARYKTAMETDKNQVIRDGKYEKEALWADSQRNAFKNGVLQQEKIDELNNIGFSWSPLEEKRDDKIVVLKEYGSLCFVKGHTVYNGYPIGKWLNYFKRMKHTLSQEQIDIITELGYDWGGKQERHWLDTYEILKAEVQKVGYIGSEYVTEDGYYLGSWLSNQIQHMKNNKLNKSFVKMLGELSIGYDYRASYEEQKWQSMYEEYLKYIKENNSLVVSKKLNFGLNKWVNHQKRRYRENRLEIEQEKKLVVIGLNLEKQ